MPWNATSRGEILVIDDDTAERETLSTTLQEAGYDVICFADGAALFSQARSRVPVCVFLEVRAPDKVGLCILKKLRDHKCPAPIFVTSANGDISTAVSAIRNGAVDFIEKPFRGTDIVVRIDAAIGDSAQSAIRDDILDASFHFPGREALTLREREVLARIAAGDSNKEIARQIGLSSRTVEGYRASILKKAGVRNSAELLRLVFGNADNA